MEKTSIDVPFIIRKSLLDSLTDFFFHSLKKYLNRHIIKRCQVVGHYAPTTKIKLWCLKNIELKFDCAVFTGLYSPDLIKF